MLHIVIGILKNKQNQVLIARRGSHQHQAGKWEFAGGKVEQGESAQHALLRELNEELGIKIEHATPLIQIQHDYTTRRVFLEVYTVSAWQGEAYGKEGQPIRWVNREELDHYTFPRANKAILQALKLPTTCLITPEIHTENEFQQGMLQCLERGIKLIQFRAKTLRHDVYLQRAEWLITQCKRYNTLLVLNSPPSQFSWNEGLHLTSLQLLAMKTKPKVRLLSAACHTQSEVLKAQQIGVDFIFLSPIKATTSHPDLSGRGWQWFSHSIKNINIPTYALGGLGTNDINVAIHHGAQGIAAISQLWSGSTD
jgi:8-oxo-dGTP diphosphatase